MTYQQISNMIESIGVPYAYYQFPAGTEQPTPFICFYFPDADDFIADNTNYQKIEALMIEVYTDEKDFTLESTTEAVLKEAGLVYSRTESYIDSERMHMTVYETEVLING